MPKQLTRPDGVLISGEIRDRYDEVLSVRALELVALLHRELDSRVRGALAAREDVYRAVAAGRNLDFLPETKWIRDDPAWRVAPLAHGLEDRRVEITGPASRKMTINALNSGANAWLADQEDAVAPLWENVVSGPLNLKDALDDEIDFVDGNGDGNGNGKSYRVVPFDERPTVIFRPRGWHLPEKHITVDGEVVSGALVDFALYLVACGQKQIDLGKGPYFYLPKLESYLEARIWNDAFLAGQRFLGIPRGTIRATCLIETLPAAFQMQEILYELRDHAAGLNAGRWDYLFSIVKTYRTRGADFVIPDRGTVTMTVPFMRAYTKLLVRTCHERGASAIGGMAAFVPSRDEAVNELAFRKVADDKAREANDGFDGSWVAHPAMVATCRDAFTNVLGEAPNQIVTAPGDTTTVITAADLLDVKSAAGEATSTGLRSNVDVSIRYLKSWIEGTGAVAIHNLMEDAATVEISRSQIWQQIHNGVVLADSGELVTADLVRDLVDEVIAELPGAPADYDLAKETFLHVAVVDDYANFLTLPAYERMPSRAV